jgi:hypothetical protein
MTGNPDPGPLRHFDARLNAARGAMRKLRKEHLLSRTLLPFKDISE